MSFLLTRILMVMILNSLLVMTFKVMQGNVMRILIVRGSTQTDGSNIILRILLIFANASFL
jgi:hypothetical protein